MATADEVWLVTGATGQLGSHVVSQLLRLQPSVARVIALSSRPREALEAADPRLDTETLDFSAPPAAWRESAEGLLRGVTHIINAAAIASVKVAYENPNLAAAVNVAAASELARIASEPTSTVRAFAHVSTDMVFGGEASRFYTEDMPPAPCSRYGASKVAGEAAVLRCGDASRVFVARVPLMFGTLEPVPGLTTLNDASGSFFLTQLRALANHKGDAQTVSAFADEHRTPLSFSNAASALISLTTAVASRRADAPAVGVIHVAGPQRVSRFEMLCMMRDALGNERADVAPNSRNDVAAPEPRAADLSLDTSKLRALMPDVELRRVEEEVPRVVAILRERYSL